MTTTFGMGGFIRGGWPSLLLPLLLWSSSTLPLGTSLAPANRDGGRISHLQHPHPQLLQQLPVSSRRNWLVGTGAIASSLVVSSPSSASAAAAAAAAVAPNIHHPFRYSPDWTGTALPWIHSLTEAMDRIVYTNDDTTATANNNNNNNRSINSIGTWPMARWPDPVLRMIADPVDDAWFGTSTLRHVADALAATARTEGAVGLAAQQCGINARLVYLETTTTTTSEPTKTKRRSFPRRQTTSSSTRHDKDKDNTSLVMVNPCIVQRSPEQELQVWQESCLVFPPTFTATVLRDAWVDVAYRTVENGDRVRRRFHGGTARIVQHELDHDRGILVTDHVGLAELESNVMRAVETWRHEERRAVAYARYIEDVTTTNIAL